MVDYIASLNSDGNISSQDIGNIRAQAKDLFRKWILPHIGNLKRAENGEFVYDTKEKAFFEGKILNGVNKLVKRVYTLRSEDPDDDLDGFESLDDFRNSIISEQNLAEQ